MRARHEYRVPELTQNSEAYTACVNKFTRRGLDPNNTRCLKLKPRTEQELKKFTTEFNALQRYFNRTISLVYKKRECSIELSNNGQLQVGELLAPSSGRRILQVYLERYHEFTESQKESEADAIRRYAKITKDTPKDIADVNHETLEILALVPKLTKAERLALEPTIEYPKHLLKKYLSPVEQTIVLNKKLTAYLSNKRLLLLILRDEIPHVEVPEEFTDLQARLRKQLSEARDEEFESQLKQLKC